MEKKETPKQTVGALLHIPQSAKVALDFNRH